MQIIQSAIQSVITIQPEIQAAIGAVIAFAVSYALNRLTQVWPALASYLGPYKDNAIHLLSGAVVAWLAVQLNAMPTYEPVIQAALQFLVVLIGFFGLPFLTFKNFQRRGVRGFASG